MELLWLKTHFKIYFKKLSQKSLKWILSATLVVLSEKPIGDSFYSRKAE